jgi:hypothetical protein
VNEIDEHFREVCLLVTDNKPQRCSNVAPADCALHQVGMGRVTGMDGVRLTSRSSGHWRQLCLCRVLNSPNIGSMNYDYEQVTTNYLVLKT